MTDIVERFRKFTAFQGSAEWPKHLKEAAAEIERLRAFAQFIVEGYARVDINHEDFRVEAYKNACDALGIEPPILTSLGSSVKCEHLGIKGIGKDKHTGRDVVVCNDCGEQMSVSDTQEEKR